MDRNICTVQAGPIRSVSNVAEEKILQYATNYLAFNGKSDSAALDKMEVTGLRNFQAMTKFAVKEEAFANKLANQLRATDCPEAIIKAITDDIQCVDEEMSIQTDCKVEGSEGHIYKIAYCLSREDTKAKFAMVVFGASFNASMFERYEEITEPIFEERPISTTKGMLWWKETVETIKKFKTGEKVTKTPKFKGMSNGELQACMGMLEAKACEKVLQTSSPVHVSLPMIGDKTDGWKNPAWLSPQWRAITVALIGVGAIGVGAWACGAFKKPKPAKPSSSYSVFNDINVWRYGN